MPPTSPTVPTPLDLTSLDDSARDAWADAVVALVNSRYEATEGMLWAPGVTRTDRAEVLERVAAGTLLHLCAPQQDGTPQDAPVPAHLVGVVNVLLPRDGEGTAEFGMLAVDPSAAGHGLGQRLVRAAEDLARDHGCSAMEIDVLRPTEGTAEAKEKLGAWYPRLGYTLVATTPIDDVRPDMTASLSVPCVLDRYRRSLHPTPGTNPTPSTDQEPT